MRRPQGITTLSFRLTVVVYVVPGSRPVTGQLAGVVHEVMMQSVAGPATGHVVTLYLAQGPPGGGVTATVAVVGLVGVASTPGDLQSHVQGTSGVTKIVIP